MVGDEANEAHMPSLRLSNLHLRKLHRRSGRLDAILAPPHVTTLHNEPCCPKWRAVPKICYLELPCCEAPITIAAS